MKEYFFKKKILLIVAHPDDEILGVGATMHHLIHQYDCLVRVVILGEGITSRADHRNPDLWQAELKIHKKNILEAQKSIGFESVATYNFPDNRFDSIALLDIIKIIETEKQNFQPEIIFTHHGGDLNIDHQRVFQAVMTASRPLKEEKVKTIITFQTPSSTEWQAPNIFPNFLPNLFFEVNSENIQAKIQAMQSYQFESRMYPHPRSPEALNLSAKYWGMVIAKDFAEPFMIIRSIISN